MKQPREIMSVVIDNNGVLETVTRSVALQGMPTGPPKPGPIGVCPITNEVLYEADMVRYKGRLYSSEGAQEEIEDDSKRANK